MDATTVGWFPVATLLLGYAVRAFSDWLQHRRASEREHAARQAARRDQLEERRADFERQNLLELQDAMMDVVRTTVEMHHHDEKVFKQTGQWHKQLYDDDLAEKSRLANARSGMLVVRVRDQLVRDLVGQVKHHSGRVAFSKSLEEGDKALFTMTDQFESLNEHIGVVLRELDSDQHALLPSTGSAS